MSLVSVIVPTYNRRETIQAAIASVQRQTFADWELVVVDDGSTDDTAALIEGSDPRHAPRARPVHRVPRLRRRMAPAPPGAQRGLFPGLSRGGLPLRGIQRGWRLPRPRPLPSQRIDRVVPAAR